jgi:glycosyltransferase involved in cell wall biosynthesis
VSDVRAARPITFLVSVTGGRCAAEVLDVIAPALRRLGDWRKVAHPESSLAHHAARIQAAGGSPVHLAIGAAHECYLTPALPTLFLPIWDYPEIPAVDLNRNGRMNWARVANTADMILAPSHFLAESFCRSGVSTPSLAMPIPIHNGWSDLPTWGPNLPVSLDVPHVVWGGAADPPALPETRALSMPASVQPSPAQAAKPLSGRARIKRRLRRLKPYFSNAAMERIDAYKARVLPLVGRPSPVRIAGGVARLGYRHLVRRVIGEGAHGKLRRFVLRLDRRGPDPAPAHSIPVTLGASRLTLSGLVYSATIDYEEPTTDDTVLVTAFLHAFSDRPDATLLIRLMTRPDREAHDLGRLWHVAHAPRIEARCRIVVVVGPPDQAEALVLGRSASYHVETSRSRGLSLPLLQALAAGRPAIVPNHSSYPEWVDESVGLLVGSHVEPTSWPMDGLGKHATTWNRLDWSGLRDRLVESAAIVDHEPVRYEHLSAAARERVSTAMSVASTARALHEALDRPTSRSLEAYAWA